MMRKSCVASARKGDRFFSKYIAKISKPKSARDESHFCYTSNGSFNAEQKNELKQRNVTGSLNW